MHQCCLLVRTICWTNAQRLCSVEILRNKASCAFWWNITIIINLLLTSSVLVFKSPSLTLLFLPMSHFRTTFQHSTTTTHHQCNSTSVWSVAEIRLSIPSRPYSVPNEVFVGNLSYFCEEVHLYDLFSQYSNVTNVRIVRTEDRSRSLLFGFVALKNPCEMELVSEIFNNHLHMGRQMRYALIFSSVSLF